MLVIPQRKHNLSYLQGDHFFTGTIAPLPRGRDARSPFKDIIDAAPLERWQFNLSSP